MYYINVETSRTNDEAALAAAIAHNQRLAMEQNPNYIQHQNQQRAIQANHILAVQQNPNNNLPPLQLGPAHGVRRYWGKKGKGSRKSKKSRRSRRHSK